VIKVERAEGDFARRYDRACDGRERLFRLAQPRQGIDRARSARRRPTGRSCATCSPSADVFIQNLAPGAVARLGFDPQELRRQNERLITCSISGYGDEGPYRDLKAYDLLVQAESGLSEITGNEHGTRAHGRLRLRHRRRA
jgi:crotonobetainyl-CoA:carnitine CoA-transferase CaiB-like acyl-CoA transferase